MANFRKNDHKKAFMKIMVYEDGSIIKASIEGSKVYKLL